MARNTVFIVVMIIAVGMISCRFINRPRHNILNDTPDTDDIMSAHSVHEIDKYMARSHRALPPSVKEEALGMKPIAVAQYDSASLDRLVVEDAQRLDQDPMFHRLLRRTDPDGTKVFRMVGMHVMVNPDGEEVFLPDEL